uniref:Phospholipase B-like n=1 Tax=Alexandrium catenella TaxID=2925 RepID=A0A7S1RP19_ALECA|mmetsp:Transcript_67045/g.178571  ORF Transcript_67045/g.178571 Transcript_67045/m.178571 type:complete len:262 (+) Transcript_67045:80-865(+)
MPLARLALLGLLAASPAVALRRHAFPGIDSDNASAELVIENPVPVEPGCQCLEYAQVYANHSARCGSVFERHGEMCKLFYQKMEDNLCWNIPGDAEQGQWCYVSLDCQALNGGAHLRKASVAWKRCSPRQDRMSRLHTVKSLTVWAKKRDIDLGMAFSMAYQALEGITWEQLAPYFPDGTAMVDDLRAVPDQWKSKIEGIVHSGPNTIIRSSTGRAPEAIIDKHDLYVTAENTEWTRGKRKNEVAAHPFQMTEVTLVKTGA